MRHPLPPGWITLALFSLLTAALPAQEMRELALARVSIRAPALTARALLGEEIGAAAASTESASAAILAAPVLTAGGEFMPRMVDHRADAVAAPAWASTADAGDWSRRFLAPASAAPRFACLAPQRFGLSGDPVPPLTLAAAPPTAAAPTAPPAEWFLLRLDDVPPRSHPGPEERVPALDLPEISPLDPTAGGLALYPW